MQSMDRISILPDYDIPRIICGGWQLSTGHALKQALDMADAKRAFETLLEHGFNTFDGADIYTGVEDFYGRIIRERRALGLSIPQIHTKFVPDLKDLEHVDYGYVERIILRSLDRLGLDRLDMVQFHWWDYEKRGMIDTARHLARLQAAGVDVIAKIEVEAGHGGTTGRYKQWKEVSFENAWCLRTMGVA